MTYSSSWTFEGDRLRGHDWPGSLGPGFVQFELDELELGVRAAMGLDDPEQWWWELYGPRPPHMRGWPGDRDLA